MSSCTWDNTELLRRVKLITITNQVQSKFNHCPNCLATLKSHFVTFCELQRYCSPKYLTTKTFVSYSQESPVKFSTVLDLFTKQNQLDFDTNYLAELVQLSRENLAIFHVGKSFFFFFQPPHIIFCFSSLVEWINKRRVI